MRTATIKKQNVPFYGGASLFSFLSILFGGFVLFFFFYFFFNRVLLVSFRTSFFCCCFFLGNSTRTDLIMSEDVRWINEVLFPNRGLLDFPWYLQFFVCDSSPLQFKCRINRAQQTVKIGITLLQQYFISTSARCSEKLRIRRQVVCFLVVFFCCCASRLVRSTAPADSEMERWHPIGRAAGQSKTANPRSWLAGGCRRPQKSIAISIIDGSWEPSGQL